MDRCSNTFSVGTEEMRLVIPYVLYDVLFVPHRAVLPYIVLMGKWQSNN